MSDRCAGKSVIVTGGASGMGYACAQQLAAAGARVMIADLTPEATAQAVDQLGGAGHFVAGHPLDVSVRAQVEAMVTETVRLFGGVDALICCAGIGDVHDFLDMTDEQFDRHLRVNLKGTFLPFQAVARHMVDTGRSGSLVATSSTTVQLSMGNQTAYAASKAGVDGFVRSTAVALSAYNIRSNSVAPGPMRTPMFEGGVPRGGEVEQLMRSRTPLARIADPSEMAAAAIFFASDDASFITGQTLFVDGGRTVLSMVVPVPE